MDIITLALAKKYVQATLTGAGALKGEDGKSAYEVAKKNGFSGTEQEWLESLRGQAGQTPHIGDNGNWFIGNVDTNISSRPILNYNLLENKPKLNGVDINGNIEITAIPTAEIDSLFS